MRGFPTREQVEHIKEMYPIGTVIELTGKMDDPYAPIEQGMQGDIVAIDDLGAFVMKWQNGRSLSVYPHRYTFKVMSKPDERELTTQTSEYGGLRL